MTVSTKPQDARLVLLPAAVWRELIAPRVEASADDPLFRSRKGGPCDPSQVLRIVRVAAARPGPQAKGTPHLLRQPRQPTRWSAALPFTSSSRRSGTRR